ncbi:MAG TPA: M1 family aminopeptidase [Sphingomonadaceae bacterium]|nr:M1 family aminopeptidase [Sphingomonadaceae bacterium]
MFSQIARFEFGYQTRNPVFWVASILFFLLAFGSIASDNIQLGAGGNVLANSPYATSFAHLFLSLFYMFVTTAFVANVVVRDDDTKFGPIVRSTRITKFQYLFGRFAGAFAAAALAFLAVPLGLLVGSGMPWLDKETIGPVPFAAYAFAYAVLSLPVIFLTSAIFFALATATRSMMTTYVGLIVFLVLFFVTSNALSDRPDLETLRALIDPFALEAFTQATRYWTAAERNVRLVPMADLLLWNRLLWLGLSFAFLALAYALYRFADQGMSKRQQRRQRLADQVAAAPPVTSSARLPDATAGGAARAQLWSRTRLEIGQIVRSPAFFVLLGLGLVMTISAIWSDGGMYGTPTIPVTRATIQMLGVFGIIPLIVAIYYAGELVWRERDRKVHELIDATALPNWAYLVPKILGLTLVLVAMLVVSVLTAILVQLAKGYTDIEPGKYVLWYLLPNVASMFLIAVLAIFVQALSPSKYVGWGMMVVYLVVQIVADRMGFQHKLYDYGGAPIIQYSDMNGAGGFWQGQLWFRLYWFAIAIVMLVVVHLLWRRGTETRFRPRLKRGLARLKGTPGVIAGVSLAVAAVTGGWIFYNTNVLNEYRTSDYREKWSANYEKLYLKYETLPQPNVVEVKLNVALYPQETRAVTRGRYLLRNLTNQPIRDVHVRETDEETKLVRLDLQGGRLVSEDEEHGYRIFRLAAPMAPGDTRTLDFETLRQSRGFRNSGGDIELVRNGTFLSNFALAPAIGMDRGVLLGDRTKRREYGLPAELRVAKLEDLSATAKPYFGGWTTSDVTVSTSADQTPLAPGAKVSDVTQGGRRTARFVAGAPIHNFFSIQSARYAEKRVAHDGVDVAVYYHPDHAWNVDRMLRAMTTSLDYYKANFGPYQFPYARIIEFPGYRTFAQAFAGTMPYSESIGFVADNSNPEKIDYLTYVTAHELAHQYWAHQVIGANMQGATSLSETLSQYSALMVMKKLEGPDKIRRFLKFELDGYLRARGSEAIEEQPLGRVENQQYIHYNKGSVAMYLLQDRLGEAAVNRALARLVERFKFKGAPFPRSTDLVDELRKEAKTPQDQQLITDLFEKITIYDLKVNAPTAVRRPDGKWAVTVPVEARKFYADGKGVETATPLAEPIFVGLFTAEPGRGAFDSKNVIRMERQPIRSGKQVLRFVTDRKPTHAGVDPYNFHVDRNSGDNVRPVG